MYLINNDLPIFPVMKFKFKAFENAYESSIIFSFLIYANIPVEFSSDSLILETSV